MTITQADRLANEPVRLTLADGQTYELLFGFGALRKIEKKFGSARHLAELLGDFLGDDFHDAVFETIAIGLWRQRISEEKLETLLVPQDSMDYAIDLLELLAQNFPHQLQGEVLKQIAEAKAEVEKLTAEEQTPESTGTASTSTPQSLSAVPTSSFG